MSTPSFRSLARSLTVVLGSAALAVAAGCSASSPDAGETGSSSGAITAAAAAPHKYAAIVGTWDAVDAVPSASADGIPAYTTYTFDADGSFNAFRSCPRADAGGITCDATVIVSGTWQIFTTLPDLPRIDLTFAGTRETYVFSMQCDLLVLDGVDALFQHDVASLPGVADGAICEDVTWNSLAVCPSDIGACDHETHRCLQAS